MTSTMKKGMRLCAALAMLGIAACSPDELLQVDNPTEIQIQSLNDVKLLAVQLNGVEDQFYTAYTSNLIQYSNYLTDEILSGLNWEDYARASQRIASYLEGPTEGLYEQLQRGLRMGDGLAERIRGWETEYPSRNFKTELATSLILAGYSATALAETMCQSVISPDPNDPSSEVLSQVQTFEVAVPYLTEGLSVAQAAGNSNLANLARTGLARAYLGQGKWTEAANAASQVQSGFKWWIPFTDIDGGRNPMHGTSHGGNFNTGIHPWFTGVHPSFNGTGITFPGGPVVAPQTDPRIQHNPTSAVGHNALTRLYKLFQGLRYGDYTGKTQAPASPACPACTGTPAASMILLAEYATDILLADYVEAQHHYYEAMDRLGGKDAEVLAFVNARRAVGNQAPVTLTGRALRTELRNQRARDLFMGGFRLGDLRRWTRFDAGFGPFAGGSYFPTGTHPNAIWGAYGAWTCFPIPISEYEGNPNLTKPLDPSVPPGI